MRYVAFKMWPLASQGRDKAHDMLRNAWRYPGYESAAVVHEARSFVHSMTTHEGLRVEGKGAAFKKRMLAEGFNVYPQR